MVFSFPRTLFLLALVLLCACTPRADETPILAEPGVGTEVEVLVASSRARKADGTFHDDARGASTAYAAFDVVVPRQHTPGAVEIGGKGRNAREHFLTSGRRNFGDRVAFRQAVSERLRRNPSYRDEAFVFVHGYNNTLGDGVFRTAQMKHDLVVSALPVHYAWPSAGSALRYAYDRDSSLLARRGLEDLIEDLSAAGVRNIILVPHSMGSQITMETLRQMSLSGRGATWERIGGVALISPDIDVDVFHSQVAEIGELPQPFLIFTSTRDKALRLSSRLTGESNRLGNLQTVGDVAELDVVVVDVTKFDDTRNSHLTALSSPTLIGMAENLSLMDYAFQNAAPGQAGLVPGTVLTVQNATAVILEPAVELAASAQ